MLSSRKYYYFFKEGSQINQIICAILINLPVFAYGSCVGWMSPATLLLQSKDTPTDVPVSNLDISLMASLSYFVCVPADYLSVYMTDKIGRKLSVMFISASCAVSWVLLLSSVNVNVMIFARSIVGIIMGGSYVACPLYTKEISDDNIRGALGCLVILFQTSGNLFTYIIGDLLAYRTVLWICLLLPVFHIILFIAMPESPSYLVKTGRDEEAQRVLAWLKCRPEGDSIILREVEHIKKEQMKDAEDTKFLLKSIVTDKFLFRAFCITMVITIGREICGAITVLNFAGEIFTFASEGTNLVLTPNQQAMMLGAVQVAGAMLASSIIEKAGRKGLLLLTSLLSGLSMCALSSWFVSRNLGAFAPTWLPIVTLCICIFCDSLGLQPISVVITSEIFSYKYRGTVLAITMSVASLLSFLQLIFFKTIAVSIGVHVVFYFFGAVCLFIALYVILFVPETKGRLREEIYLDLRTKKEKVKDKENEEKEKTIKEITVL